MREGVGCVEATGMESGSFLCDVFRLLARKFCGRERGTREQENRPVSRSIEDGRKASLSLYVPLPLPRVS